MTANTLIDRIALFRKFAKTNYVWNFFSHQRFREEIEFSDTLVVFTTLSHAEQKNVRASFDDYYDAYDLASFAVRCASFALQAKNGELLRQGVLALIIDADVMDYRSVVISLCVLNEAAGRLGVDLFQEAIAPLLEFATPSRRKLIEGYVFGQNSVKIIDHMGYELANVEGVPWFQPMAL